MIIGSYINVLYSESGWASICSLVVTKAAARHRGSKNDATFAAAMTKCRLLTYTDSGTQSTSNHKKNGRSLFAERCKFSVKAAVRYLDGDDVDMLMRKKTRKRRLSSALCRVLSSFKFILGLGIPLAAEIHCLNNKHSNTQIKFLGEYFQRLAVGGTSTSAPVGKL